MLWKRELRELFGKPKMFLYMLSLTVIGFVLWNLSNNFAPHITLYEKALPDILTLLPSYFIVFFALVQMRSYALDKKMGVLEAILATGIDKRLIAFARAAAISLVSCMQALVTMLFVEFLLRTKMNTSLASHLQLLPDVLLMGLLSLFSIALILVLVSLIICYSEAVNYLLVFAFFVTFTYIGLYHLLANLPTYANIILLIVIIPLFAGFGIRFLHSFPNDKIIME